MDDKKFGTIHDYEIVDIGLKFTQYFEGFGTSFTKYEHSVYGIGDTFDDALEDALEQIAQVIDLGALADEELIAMIKKEHAHAEIAELDDEQFYHVGVRYNIRH